MPLVVRYELVTTIRKFKIQCICIFTYKKTVNPFVVHYVIRFQVGKLIVIFFFFFCCLLKRKKKKLHEMSVNPSCVCFFSPLFISCGCKGGLLLVSVSFLFFCLLRVNTTLLMFFSCPFSFFSVYC